MSAATSPSSRSPWLVAADLFDPQPDPYAHDPVGWAHDILGVHLWSRQREVVESVRDHKRTAVRSGHGVGKTTTAAVVVMWFLDTHEQSRAITTATKWSQVEKLLWHEIGQLHARGRKRPESQGRPIFGVSPLKTQLELPDGRYAIGLSSKPENSESFAGHHAPHILVVYDEASGIHPSIYEVGEGYMTTDGARALLIGNPTRPDGEFHAAFTSKRADYSVLHISALESPPISGEPVPDDLRIKLTGREWVESRKRAWGEDSPIYKIRVLGEFPPQGSDSVIPLNVVEEAQDRDLPIANTLPGLPPIIGVDVARFGDDESVIATRINNRVRIAETLQGQATTTLVGHVIRLARELRATGDRPRVVVDDVGVGGGVTDMLREADPDLFYDGPVGVRGFNGGERAYRPDEYPNRRSELWFTAAEQLADLDLDEDEQLAADLTAPRYVIDSRGRRVVEPKAQTKQRLRRSPDRADAVLLTLVPPRGDVIVLPRQPGTAAGDVPADLRPRDGIDFLTTSW